MERIVALDSWRIVDSSFGHEVAADSMDPRVLRETSVDRKKVSLPVACKYVFWATKRLTNDDEYRTENLEEEADVIRRL